MTRHLTPAYTRGVKLIGAPCHYASAELDAGPIIGQDVVRVTHHHNVDDRIMPGRDVERQVLSRGLRYHLENRVLLHGAENGRVQLPRDRHSQHEKSFLNN